MAVVLMLATPRGKVNGPALVFGWLIGLAIVGTIVLLVAGGISASVSGQPQHSGREPALPGWMKTIDSFTPVRSASLGAALSGPNPKNLMLTVAAGAAIAQAGISAGKQAIVFAVFALLATVGPGAPLAVYYALGDRSGGVLGRMRDWMIANNQVIMSVLCLVIGAKLIGDAISGFTS